MTPKPLKTYSANTLGQELVYVSQAKVPWLRTWIMGIITGLLLGATIWK